MNNELIAEKVMGWEVEGEIGNGSVIVDTPAGLLLGFDPLADMNNAMLVVEKINNDGLLARIIQLCDGNWECLFSEYDTETGNWYSHEEATSKSLPTAICTAALKAMENSDA